MQWRIVALAFCVNFSKLLVDFVVLHMGPLCWKSCPQEKLADSNIWPNNFLHQIDGGEPWFWKYLPRPSTWHKRRLRCYLGSIASLFSMLKSSIWCEAYESVQDAHQRGLGFSHTSLTSCNDGGRVRMRTDIGVGLVAQYYPTPLLPRIGV